MEPKLCLFFWVLLLHHQRPSMSSTSIRNRCRPGTTEECEDARFVPGHTLLGEGIDIVTMKTSGSFLLDLQDVGEECAVCENPHNHNVLQKLPKALVDWRPETSCSGDIQSSMSHSIVSVANEATSVVKNNWKVGLNLSIGENTNVAVGGSHSQMAEFAYRKSLTDNYRFLSHKLECAFYSFRLGSNASLTPHFEKALEELPDSYGDNTTSEYRRLIENYGTHYITRVKAGGRTQELTAVKVCQVAMKGLQMYDVQDCLKAEAEIGILSNSKRERCKNQLGFSCNFHQTFSEHIWEVTGGNATFDLLSNDKATADVFEKWMESLKTQPGLVSYSVESIHNLVTLKGPKKENLRQAISDYINEEAITQKCSCPGHQGNDCSCTCAASRYTSSNCCPTRQGAAKLQVTIKHARNLNSDFWSRSDAYVIFTFDTAGITTRTILDDDNPSWYTDYDLGIVELSPNKKYTIEIWDADVRFDDLLGKCEQALTLGENSATCHLNSGWITYSVRATCVDHLQGRFCQDYKPVPPRV